jgi:hypothetical protein
MLCYVASHFLSLVFILSVVYSWFLYFVLFTLGCVVVDCSMEQRLVNGDVVVCLHREYVSLSVNLYLSNCMN